MITILKSVIVGSENRISKVQFTFLFDIKSELPKDIYQVYGKTYIIAEDSTAVDNNTKTVYKYTNNSWIKTANNYSGDLTPISNITASGTYSFGDNYSEGMNSINVSENINGGGETVEINMTIDKTTLAYTTDVNYQDAADAINAGKKLSFNITTDGQTYTTDKYLYVENGSSAYMFLIYVLTNDFSYITWTGAEEQFTGTSMNGLVDDSGK